MNNSPRLSISGVEYLDYSWGIWSGCWNLVTGICQVEACWAKGIANRFSKLYPYGFEPHYYPEAINSPIHLKKPSIISVGWVGDVIGYGIEHKEDIFDTIYNCPQHKFLFLTKNPERLPDWSPFPDNAWVGVSVTNFKALGPAMKYLSMVKASVKYLSCEPLLESILKPLYSRWPSAYFGLDLVEADFKRMFQWVIIGPQTNPTVYPEIEWVKEIVEACDKAGIPVFLKNKLLELVNYDSPETTFAFNKEGYYRQEMP